MNSRVLIDNKIISYKLIDGKSSRSSPLIVFLHDGLGSIIQWDSFPEKISSLTGFPVLVYDRPGHADSDFPDSKKNGDFFLKEAELLIKIIQNIKPDNPLILIGSSDGGTISLLFASLFPERTKTVITIAAHTFVEDKTIQGVKILKEKFLQGGFQKALSKFHKDKTNDLFLGWSDLWLSDEFRNWNIFDALKKISCPVLAIQGNMDEYGTPEQLYMIKKYVSSHCEIKVIGGTKHFPYLEKENEVSVLISEFIFEKLS